jgi:hypothetical protein
VPSPRGLLASAGLEQIPMEFTHSLRA